MPGFLRISWNQLNWLNRKSPVYSRIWNFCINEYVMWEVASSLSHDFPYRCSLRRNLFQEFLKLPCQTIIPRSSCFSPSGNDFHYLYHRSSQKGVGSVMVKVWGVFFLMMFFLLDNSTSTFSDELCDSDTIATWTFMVAHRGLIGSLKPWFSVRLLKFSWVKLAFRTQPFILWDAVTLANGSSFRFYIQFCWEENPRSMKQWEVEHFWVDICGWFPDFRSSPLKALRPHEVSNGGFALGAACAIATKEAAAKHQLSVLAEDTGKRVIAKSDC